MAGPHFDTPTAPASASAPAPLRTIALRLTELTRENFAPFGQVADVQPDRQLYGPDDAQLDLSRGNPRLYLMRLDHAPLKFDRVTHHARVTQCLGSLSEKPWYLGVIQPTIIGASEKVDLQKYPEVLKGDGYDYLPPAVEDIRVFKIEGHRFLKMHAGTWHVGPLFEDPHMDFYNLELSDTNVIDHPTYSFKKNKRIVFEVNDS